MSWEKTTVGEIVTTRKGYAFKSSEYVNKGVPVVRVSDYTMDSISDADLKYYPYDEKQNYIDYELHEKDVIVQTVGSWQNNPASVVGKVVRVPYFLEGALLNQNAVKIMPAEGIDNNFLFYRLKTEEFKGHVLGEARGAANQASITLDTIKSFDFLIPDCLTQKKIGNILSKYDELIENNRKQIKLLEETAQRLYKEWFVDLRFPGYEGCKIVDGVPVEWKKKKLDEIADVIMGQSPKSEFYNKEHKGLPFHQGVGSYGARFVQDDTYSTSFTKVAEANSILFSVRAPVGRLNITKNKIVIGRGIAAINSKSGFQSYLFYALKERFFKDDILGNGAIFASISKNELLNQVFVIPDEKIMSAYEKIAAALDKKIEVVDMQLQQLVEARDRLLPKLMNGEIEV